MAIIKCKMCGGELALIEGQSVAECEYCGSKQTVPAADDEKKLIQFERAERLRKNCEFDKAAGLYEAIVADYRQEAEAYWGLVLCKYGIEYVDDPVTGKKIPTCHRSSFDSIMEDADFEQTLENADAAARRVYREEAKQIEEIRKGIIAVSANEAPYDIFICYKETDEKGQRTLDSVLAQDVYDMLTEKGYRVFFSRITLEDKLGVEFEPYIFAALNSAKIMLAFGTDYEYFNAVWVKNEWSRFLKLMAKDKGKHLIPCFKGIDAYDMPKEFAKLQAQDLGKLGAMQDLQRGIEKLLPKQVGNTTVIQEKVVVGGSGGSNKIASLLDRGNMALEDGDWAKADSFFEDVLNNDSKNAQAYMGKTLAQERCRTMDALVRKRKDAHQSVQAETLYIKERIAHMNDAAERFSLPGYVDGGDIQKLYTFDRSYESEVAGRQKQYREEELWWQNHKLLARAEKFATGAVAEHLQNEKKHLFAQLNERVKKAQEAEARVIAKLEAQYDAALAEADKRAEQLYSDGLARREADYQKWLEKAKRETEPETLKTLAGCFDRLRDYQDSRNLAEHCRKRADDEQAKLDAEKARKAEEARRQAAAQRKRQKTIAMIVMPVAIAVIVFLVVWSTVIVPNSKYKDAVALMEVGKYEEAIAVFEALDGYQDSAEKISECNTRMLDAQYDAAAALMEAGNYEEAAAAFAALQGYRDSGELLAECRYQQAVALENAGDIVLALRGFAALRDYKDANGRTDALRKTYQLCLQRETVSAGYQHTVALKGDGTVVAVGDNTWGACNVSGWTDIVAISAGGSHTVGLKADGTVVAVGYNQSGQCNVSDWSDIIAIRVGAAHTVGLKADGTVVAVGNNGSGECNVSDWTDIIAIGTGVSHTVGLRADGTVVAVGYEKHGGCNVSGWSDIIAISAGRDYTVGLKADGTVVATKYSGDDYIGQCDVSDWTGIIAISTYENHTVGLKADGTVVAVGQNFTGQCEVSGWTEIVAISTGTAHTVGLRTDGTVVAVGYNNKGQRDTNGWTGIRLPAISAEQQAAMERAKAAEEDRLAKEYAAAEALANNGEKVKAALAFGKLGGYGDAKERSRQLWREAIQKDVIGTGYGHTVGLKADGTVVAVGSNSHDRCNVSDWTDIVAIGAGGWHTVGLKTDGTVVAIGENTYGQCDVDRWREITDISAGEYHTVGLKADGTVVAVGKNESGQCDVSDWTGIIAISAGDFHTVGLKADGTVVAVGLNADSRCDVSDWTDIVAVSAGGLHTVGLKANGTVVAVGYTELGGCNVSGWTDIVAIDAGDYHTVGLKADGTVVAVGDNQEGQCNVSDWTDIVAVSAGSWHAVGLKADGTVVAVGENANGQCKVSGWTGIKLP